MAYKIVLFPKIQVDTLVAYFLLKTFGETKFPGISQAPVEFWSEIPSDKSVYELEEEGVIFIDLGNGKFDHHALGENNKEISASHLVAKYLEIDDREDLQKLLEFARRDDLEGKGTISRDFIDRAFGFSGLLMSLNKTYTSRPHFILDTALPLIAAHHTQELQRYEALPKEFEELKMSGKVKQFTAVQLGKQINVVYVESDNPALASFLRSRAVGAGLVIQKAKTGHVNFISRQSLNLQLHKLARQIKLLEAEANGIVLNIDSMEELEKAGRTDGLNHWYYDTRANTLQNGGLNPQDIPPSKLTYQDIELATKQSLNLARTDTKNIQRPNNTYNNRGSTPRPWNNHPRPKSNDGFRRSHGAIIID